MKESCREDVASHSGLEPYAGDGDVAGVALEKARKILAGKGRAHRVGCGHVQDQDVALVPAGGVGGGAQDGSHAAVHDVDLICGKGRGVRGRGAEPVEGLGDLIPGV